MTNAAPRSEPREASSHDPLADLEPGPTVKLGHPGRRVAGAVVLVLLAWFGDTVVTNPNFQWPVVGHYLFSREIVAGVLITVQLTVCISVTRWHTYVQWPHASVTGTRTVWQTGTVRWTTSGTHW